MPVNCWAAELGGCDIQSREHYASRSLFLGDKVRVHGLPWCKDAPVTIGLSSATAKILCRYHNSALSPLDEAAGVAFKALRDAFVLQAERTNHPANAPLKFRKFRISATLLERWFLKTLINLTYEREHLIGVDGNVAGRPSLRLVQTCFGALPFLGSSGMYTASYEGMTLRPGEELEFFPLIKDDRAVLHGFFRFYGVHFMLALDPNGLQIPLHAIETLPESWRHARLQRPFRKINATIGARPSHEIKFMWLQRPPPFDPQSAGI